MKINLRHHQALHEFDKIEDAFLSLFESSRIEQSHPRGHGSWTDFRNRLTDATADAVNPFRFHVTEPAARFSNQVARSRTKVNIRVAASQVANVGAFKCPDPCNQPRCGAKIGRLEL